MRVDFSVIVCTYNPKIRDLKFTLDSIICQKGLNFEIIVSDDGSVDNREDFIVDYFEHNNFKNYSLRMDTENKGTVQSIIRAQMLAKGKYIKTIGQGDSLTDELVLRDVYNYMESNSAECVFTKMSLFKWQDEQIKYISKSIPRRLSPWIEGNKKSICENVIVFNDQISGASIFLKKEYSEKMMDVMRISTKYMEDLFQYISLINNDRIFFFDRMCIMYECGEGISTSSNSSSKNKMKNDKDRFLNYLFEHYCDNQMVQRRCHLENIEHTKSSKILKVIKKVIAEPKWIYFRILR